MQAVNQSPLLSESPSFNSYSSNRLAEIAAKVIEEFTQDQDSSGATYRNDEEPPMPLKSSKDQPPQHEDVDNEEGNDEDFEFAVVGRDPHSPISADEIFSNGQIRPIYPIFNRDLLFADGHDDDSKPHKKTSPLRLPLRKLMAEDRDNDYLPSCSSSEADDLEGIPSGTYCVWKPKSVEASPDRCKKSNSTGSSKPWKFRDLLPRSNSDGKDTYVFLSPSKSMKKKNDKTEKAPDRAAAVQKADQHRQQQQPKETRNSISNPDYSSSTQAKVAAKGKVKAKGVSGDTVSAHEIHYVRNRTLKEEDRRRSYLPYRQDLVGFFGNVNGLGRSLHPF